MSCWLPPSRACDTSRTRGGRRCAPCARDTSSSSIRPWCSDPDRGSARRRARSPFCCIPARCRDVTPFRWTTLVVVLLLVAVAGVMLGTMKLPPRDVLRGLLGQGAPMEVAVVRTLRLPRVVLAMLVGAGLGAAGAALQGAPRNGLAGPSLLRVSGEPARGAAAPAPR